MTNKRTETFFGDLRTNGWRYAVPLLGMLMFYGLRVGGAEVWLAVLLPGLAAGALGNWIARRRR